MRQADQIDDAALDRELQVMLSVDPSPDFLARVRMNIANDESSARFPYTWITAAVMMTVVTVVVAISLFRPSVTRETTPDEPIISAAGPDIQLPSSAGSEQINAEATTMTPRQVRRRPAQPSLGVLISADDTRAFEELLKSVAERQFEVAPGDQGTQGSDLSSNITMSPIIFEPIQLDPMDKGVFQ